VIKESPTLGRIAAMVAFTLSCVALFLWMWLSFGGPIPIKPKGYRFEASFNEAALLVEQADVRIAGLDVGKVTDKHLDPRTGRTIAEIELDDAYAPIPKDTRTILRQKALLGETYVELSPGSPTAPKLEEHQLLPRKAVEESVQIDEIVRVFDKPTRTAFQGWIRELAHAIEKGRGENLNDALGNLPEFVASGRDVLQVLDSEEPALHRLVRNSGRTLEAVNERRGQLRELVVNANDFFGALASRNEALAETVFILPTFLNESRLTLNRLRGFARNTRPLVRDLQPVARDLRPTLHDLGRLAPDLKALFRNLGPLIDESKRNLPPAARFIRGAEPLLEALHVYLPELNPVLSFLNYQQEQVADFIMTGSGTLNATLPPRPGEGPRHYLRGYTAINSRSVGIARTRPDYERANSYPAPNYLKRNKLLGIVESFDCKPTGKGEVHEPANNQPPCYVQPNQLWDNKQFPRLVKGGAPLRPPPKGTSGTRPPTP
jgi:phospholipid/cholesterol/gamma-HCH transport system substrate-binding protein